MQYNFYPDLSGMIGFVRDAYLKGYRSDDRDTLLCLTKAYPSDSVSKIAVQIWTANNTGEIRYQVSLAFTEGNFDDQISAFRPRANPEMEVSMGDKWVSLEGTGLPIDYGRIATILQDAANGNFQTETAEPAGGQAA